MSSLFAVKVPKTTYSDNNKLFLLLYEGGMLSGIVFDLRCLQADNLFSISSAVAVSSASFDLTIFENDIEVVAIDLDLPDWLTTALQHYCLLWPIKCVIDFFLVW